MSYELFVPQSLLLTLFLTSNSLLINLFVIPHSSLLTQHSSLTTLPLLFYLVRLHQSDR